MVGAKGDIALDAVLMEAKSSTAQSMSLKHDWLMKISAEARSEGKRPALAVSFVREDGTPLKDGEWVMIPKWLWEQNIE